MNKTAKGAVAAGAAALLLLGGAGSYALWSDSEQDNAGTVTAGVLDIALTGTGTWMDISIPTAPVAIPNIANFLIVPGDVLQYDATFTITATGNNLTAEVSALPGSIDYTGGLTAENADVTSTATIDGVQVANNEITSSQAGQDVVVRSTLTFDRSTPDQVGQGGTVDLSGFQVAVQQTRD